MHHRSFCKRAASLDLPNWIRKQAGKWPGVVCFDIQHIRISSSIAN